MSRGLVIALWGLAAVSFVFVGCDDEADGDGDSDIDADIDADEDEASDSGRDSDTESDGSMADAEADGGCGFSTPVALDEVNSPSGDYGAASSADGLTLYLTSDRAGTSGPSDLWYATRSSISDVFGEPVNLSDVNSTSGDAVADLSSDGLTLCFGSDRPGGLGGMDVWCASRAATSAGFDAAAVLTEINSDGWDSAPSLSNDRLTIYFMSDRSGGAGDSDIWYATRPSTTDPFGAPENLAVVNTGAMEASPSISADGLTLYFNSDRSGGLGGQDIWQATRPDASSPFGAPQNLAEVNSAEDDQGPAISADGRTLYLNRGTSSHDIFVSTWTCP